MNEFLKAKPLLQFVVTIMLTVISALIGVQYSTIAEAARARDSQIKELVDYKASTEYVDRRDNEIKMENRRNFDLIISEIRLLRADLKLKKDKR